MYLESISAAVSIIRLFLKFIRKEKLEEEVLKAYKLQELFKRFDRLQEELAKERIGLYEYLEIRKLLRDIRDIAKALKGKVDWKRILGEFFEKSRYEKSKGIDIYYALAHLTAEVLREIIGKISDDILILISGMLSDDIVFIEELIDQSETPHEIKQSLMETLTKIGSRIKSAEEKFKKTQMITKDEKVFEDLLISLPAEYKKEREFIEMTLFPLLGLLISHDAKYRIMKYYEGFFRLPTSYETLVINCARCVSYTAKDILGMIKFFVRLYSKYLNVNACYHTYREYRPRTYIDHPLDPRYSEEYLKIKDYNFERFLVAKYQAYLKSLELQEFYQILNKLQNVKDYLFLEAFSLFVNSEENKAVITRELYEELIKSVIAIILQKVSDNPKVINYLKDKIFSLLCSEDSIMNVIRKNILPKKSLTWAMILEHDFNSYRCNVRESILISDFLKSIYKELLREFQTKLKKAKNIINEILKENIVKLVKRRVAINDLRYEGEIKNVSRFKDAIQDYIDNKEIIITPDDRGILAPGIDPGKFSNEINKLDAKIEKLLKQALEVPILE